MVKNWFLQTHKMSWIRSSYKNPIEGVEMAPERAWKTGARDWKWTESPENGHGLQLAQEPKPSSNNSSYWATAARSSVLTNPALPNRNCSQQISRSFGRKWCFTLGNSLHIQAGFKRFSYHHWERKPSRAAGRCMEYKLLWTFQSAWRQLQQVGQRWNPYGFKLCRQKHTKHVSHLLSQNLESTLLLPIKLSWFVLLSKSYVAIRIPFL